MSTLASAAEAKKAAAHLTAVDPVLAPVIARTGLYDVRPHQNYYQALVNSIVGQQLSVTAAAAIKRRLAALYDHFPAAEELLGSDVEQLRAIGLSYAKARYIIDLAQHVVDGRVEFNQLDALSNEDIIAELTAVKGIGVWTVHMFLMFCMGRLDVLPTGDLGIRNGVRALYGLDRVPTPADIEEVARRYRWHPYESVASWYVWESLDNAPKIAPEPNV